MSPRPDEDRPASRRDLRAFVLRAIGLTCVVGAPLLIYGAVFGDDIFYHVLYTTFFDEQLRAGDLYPRWLFNGNAGLGSPVFFFYGSVPSFATSLFSWFGLDVPHQLAGGALAAIVASGVAAFYWARMLVGAKAASSAALLYMVHPYHLNIDLYVRFAYAEFWSFVWMPLIAGAMLAVARGRPHAWLIGSAAYALLIATHPPSVLLFTLLLAPYLACVVLTLPAARRIGAIVETVAALALGVALAGAYLVPALTTQAYASYLETFRAFGPASFFDYGSLLRSSLLISHAWRYGADDSWDTLYADAAAFSLILAIACAVVASVGAASAAERRAPILWGIATIVIFIAMTPVSLPMWELVRVLQRIQFPTRLNALLVVALIPLVGLAVARVRTPRSVVVTCWLIVGLYIATFWGPAIKEIHWGIAKHGSDLIDLGAAIMPPETRPATVPKRLAGGAAIETLGRATPGAAFASGAGIVSVEAWGPGGIRIATRNDRADTVVLHQFAYPGWDVRAEPTTTVVVGHSDEGLLTIALPAGDYRVSIARGSLPSERIGLGISTGAVLAAVIAFVVGLRRRRAASRVIFSGAT